MESKKVVTYFPDKILRQGYGSLFREMFSDLITSRWLTIQLFRRNFAASYRQTVFGIFWAILVPLLSVGTFIFLSAGGILNVGDTKVAYPLYALAGTALWQLFSAGLTLSINSLVNAGAMIKRRNFPRESLIFSAVGQAIVPVLIQMVLMFLLFAVYKVVPPVTVLLVPFAMIPLLLLTLGLSFIFSVANTLVRDVGNGISILTSFLMFVTPVIYAKPPSGIVATISQYNPLYYLLAVPRDLLIYGSVSELEGYLYSTLFSVLVFVVCWLAFRLSGNKIVERI